MLCIFDKLTEHLSFLLRHFATLYNGACMLFITGLIRSFILYVSVYALMFGVIGFIFVRYLCLHFSINMMHF